MVWAGLEAPSPLAWGLVWVWVPMKARKLRLRLRFGCKARGQDGFQFVPIETLAVEQLGGGAIRVSTPNGIQVLEAGQWLYANGQVMALQSVLSQSASVAEAWAMQAPAIAASTAPVLVQLPTAPAAASVASSPAPPALPLAPAAPVIAAASAPSLTQVGVVAGGATVASASVYAGYRLISRDEASGNGATSASSTASGSPATDEDGAAGLVAPASPSSS